MGNEIIPVKVINLAIEYLGDIKSELKSCPNIRVLFKLLTYKIEEMLAPYYCTMYPKYIFSELGNIYSNDYRIYSNIAYHSYNEYYNIGVEAANAILNTIEQYTLKHD